MSKTTVLDGPRLHSWARRAVAELSARRAEINHINVFPVPDADTGSNMAFTMNSALAAAEELDEDASTVEVATALARGAVRGARGNSGLALSQVLRGVAEASGDGIDGEAIRQALAKATVFVESAIADPVEGTVISVLRAAHDAAQGETIEDVVSNAAAAARKALANTPSQLPVLREAGVVDAGGQGLVVLLDALESEILGREADAPPVTLLQSVPRTIGTPTCDHGTPAGSDAHLEVMFTFVGDAAQLTDALKDLGDSLFAAPLDDATAKVHIHSHDAGRVVEKAFSLGQVSELRFEVLPGPAPTAYVNTEAPTRRQVIAIAGPGQVADLFTAAGATVIAPDDQMEARLAAARDAFPETIVIANGYVPPLRTTHHVVLDVPRTVAGFAAIAVYEDNAPLDKAVETMEEAASEMRSAVIDQTAHAFLTPAGACGKGDYLTETTPGNVIRVSDTLDEAIENTIRDLLAEGGEQVTLLARTGVDISTDNLAARFRGNVDIMSYVADNVEGLVQVGVE
ncbi:kinase related to dihydroxyacetone kinase [Corynebacterium renale]|uniref:DAK2 domain-containing protein n=1 Tax=Corynebacterium renale TaxID=1724 RepID=UPI000DA40404|nr:DAK2 domain-containing protein [Corynebacterium renale]SQG64584.1 kinase related to dihydroxyacetone kinase [Corynebacterium renale]STC95642.1 kinase related to dihydroxyacetone kinase [Corynebacterium renale]